MIKILIDKGPHNWHAHKSKNLNKKELATNPSYILFVGDCNPGWDGLPSEMDTF